MTEKLMPKGKGIFLWLEYQPDRRLFIESLKQYDWVTLKIADGVYPRMWYNDTRDFISALASAGIRVRLWQYVYKSAGAIAQARAVAPFLAHPAVEGIDVNAESHWKGISPAEERTYFAGLRAAMRPEQTIGFSSYRYPSLHPEINWENVNQHVDFFKPQVYWIHQYAEFAGVMNVQKTVAEYKARLTNPKPLVPTLSAFSEHGWTPSIQQIERAIQRCQTEGFEAVSFWSMSHVDRRFPEIHAWTYGEPLPKPKPDPEPGDEEPPVETHLFSFMPNSNMRVRNKPGLFGTIVGLLHAGRPVPIYEVKATGGGVWVRHEQGWTALALGKLFGEIRP